MTQPTPILIGLTGRARVGKSTVAARLVSAHHFIEYSFAAPIKRALAAMLDFTHPFASFSELPKESPIAFLGKSPRELMQTLGTDWGRKMVCDDIWLRILAAELDIAVKPDSGRVVISDVRFENEAAWIRQRGGVVIHITRSAAPPVNAHASEAGVGFAPDDLHIINEGDDFRVLHEDIDNYLGDWDEVMAEINAVRTTARQME